MSKNLRSNAAEFVELNKKLENWIAQNKDRNPTLDAMFRRNTQLFQCLAEVNLPARQMKEFSSLARYSKLARQVIERSHKTAASKDTTSGFAIRAQRRNNRQVVNEFVKGPITGRKASITSRQLFGKSVTNRSIELSKPELHPDFRIVFSAIKKQGLPENEVAEATGLSQHRVRKILATFETLGVAESRTQGKRELFKIKL